MARCMVARYAQAALRASVPRMTRAARTDESAGFPRSAASLGAGSVARALAAQWHALGRLSGRFLAVCNYQLRAATTPAAKAWFASAKTVGDLGVTLWQTRGRRFRIESEP
jgi:hypothetical protein